MRAHLFHDHGVDGAVQIDLKNGDIKKTYLGADIPFPPVCEVYLCAFYLSTLRADQAWKVPQPKCWFKLAIL